MQNIHESATFVDAVCHCCAGHEKQWFNFTHRCQLAKLRCFSKMGSVAKPICEAYVLRRRHWFGRSFRVISCPALGGFSCLGGEASREAEAGGSRAAHSEAERSERRALRGGAAFARMMSAEKTGERPDFDA